MAALAASGQPVPLNTRQQLAQTYADLLAYEEAARASGLERSPEFQDLMTLVRLRTLAEIHRRNLQAKYRAPSREDIDQYYRQNPLNFTEIKLRRILVPRKNPSAGDQQEYEKKALEVANGLRERAAKGNDFEQLQKEGYARLGLILPPATDMGDRRKANLLAEYRDEVFSLSTGEVSKVKQEAFSFVIYKVEEKKLLSQETVREEISHAISKQRLDNALKEITSGVHSEFNRWYFDSGVLPINPSTNDGQQSTK
jgi:parvulin-like peptidyl-prolyl isomerase